MSKKDTWNLDRWHREQVVFLERHKDADLIVCHTAGHVKEVIYFSPLQRLHEMGTENMRRFLKEVYEEELRLRDVPEAQK